MIDARNISYSIGGKRILENISFKAEGGAFIGVLGPNGAGKSTLLSVLSGIKNPNSGKVFWLNQEIQSWKIDAFAKIRGVLQQKTEVSAQMQNEELVMMGRYPHFKHDPSEQDQKVVKSAMKFTSTSHLAENWYQTSSGGEQQRLHVARVWAQLQSENSQEPKLFLLDEPLNNLDVKYQHQVMKLAKKFAEAGNVVIAVMHDINLASFYMNRLLLLKNGKLYLDGTPDEFLTEKHLESVFDHPMHVVKHPTTNIKMAVHAMAHET